MSRYTRHGDPIIRRVLLHDRAAARTHRRVDALIDYLNAHPGDVCDEDPALARLDDLLGEADRLRRGLR